MLHQLKSGTHLAVSGARWFKDKQQEQQQALQFRGTWKTMHLS